MTSGTDLTLENTPIDSQTHRVPTSSPRPGTLAKAAKCSGEKQPQELVVSQIHGHLEVSVLFPVSKQLVLSCPFPRWLPCLLWTPRLPTAQCLSLRSSLPFCCLRSGGSECLFCQWPRSHFSETWLLSFSHTCHTMCSSVCQLLWWSFPVRTLYEAGVLGTCCVLFHGPLGPGGKQRLVFGSAVEAA